MKGKLITPKIYLNLPSKPGVYIFINPAGKPIYVGKSKSLKNRVSSYFALHLEPKTRQMVSNAKFLKYITTNSEFEAILLEANLIQKLQPKYNIELKDNKSPLYIVITNDSIPIIKTARQRDLKLIRSKKTFGPYADGSTAKAVLRNIRKSIPYGDHKPTKRKCIRAHIGLCNPCPSQVAANPKLKNVYLKNISQTTKILSGKISSAKKDIEKEIKFLSKQDRFEEARDLLKKLQNLQYISSPKELPGSYIENPNFSQDIHRRELNELEKLIDLKNLKRIECYDIAHLAGTNPTASMVTFISGEPEKSLYRHFKIRKQNFNTAKAYSQIFLALAIFVIAFLLVTQFPNFKSFFSSEIKPTQTSGPISDHYTITAADNGKTFTYVLTSRFTVILDITQYPPEKLTWTPDVVLGKISNVPAAESPNDALTRFEAVQPGVAVVQDKDFSVTIIVTAQ